MCGCVPGSFVCEYHTNLRRQLESDTAIDLLRAHLSRSRRHETVSRHGGSEFRVTDGAHRLAFSTASEPEAGTVVSMTIPGYGVANFLITRDEAIALMAHLSEVTM